MSQHLFRRLSNLFTRGTHSIVRRCRPLFFRGAAAFQPLCLERLEERSLPSSGNQLALVAATGTNNSGNPTYQVLVGGQTVGGTYTAFPTGAASFVPLLQFSPDGKHLLFAAATSRDNSGSPTGWQVVKDGQVIGGTYSGVAYPQFSPDGSHVLFAAATSTDNSGFLKGWEVVEDGQVLGSTYTSEPYPQFSPAGNHVLVVTVTSTNGSGTPTAWQVSEDGQVLGGTYTSKPYPQFNSDGSHVFFVAATGTNGSGDPTGWQVVQDGKVLGSTYTSEPFPEFSPDGSHVLFAAATSTDSSGNPSGWQVVEDGKVIGGTYSSEPSPIFSPDGSHVLFAAATSTNDSGSPTNYQVVEDGKVIGGTYTEVSSTQFSPAGSHVLYVAATSTSNSGNPTGWQVIEDGKVQGGTYTSDPSAIFSPDGSHVVFAAATSTSNSGNPTNYQVVEDGQVVDGPYPNVISLQFSPDGNHVLIEAVTSTDNSDNPTAYQVVEDRQVVGGTYSRVDSFTLQFSPDGSHVLFVAAASTNNSGNPTNWQVIEDGQVLGGTYPSEPYSVQFSPSGNHVVFEAASTTNNSGNPTGFQVVEDGQVLGGTYTAVTFLQFSPAGNHVVFEAATSTSNSGNPTGWQVVADGQVLGGTYANAVSSLQFSPAGNQVIFAAATSTNNSGNPTNWQVVENGQVISGPYPYPGVLFLQFTPEAMNQAPAPTITSFTSPVTTANVASASASGTAEAGDSISLAISDGNHMVTTTTTANASCVWSVSGINLSPLSDGPITYTVTATDGNGISATVSANAVLHATPPSSSVNALPAYSLASFTVSWSGQAVGSAIASYSVYYSDNGGAAHLWLNATTATSARFTGGIGGHTYSFYSVATDTFGNVQATPITAQASTTIATSPSVTTQPLSQTAFPGTVVTFLAAAGGIPAPAVQWQQSTDGGHSFQNIAGANSATLTFTAAAAQSGYQYQAVFSNIDGSITTNPATLTINSALTILGNPTAQTISIGQTVTFSARGSGTPKPTVQWQVSSDGGLTFSNIPGATSATFSFPATAAQNGNLYRAVFSNTAGKAPTTAARLTVSCNLQVARLPQTLTVAAGTPITLTAVVPGTSGATIQWQVSTNKGKNFTSIAGATGATYTFTPQLTDSGKVYQAIFSNPAGTKTGAVTLTVDVPPGSTTGPANQTVAAGTSQMATFTASASVGTPTPTIQWQVSSDGGLTFTNITGATLSRLTLTNLTAAQDGNRYRAVFTNPVGQVSTPAATLTVTHAPIIMLQPTTRTIIAGNPVTFTAAAMSDPQPTIFWQSSTDKGKTFTPIAGTNSATWTFTPQASDSGKLYQAVFTNSNGTAKTMAVALVVNVRPTVLTSPSSQTVIVGQTAMFTATASGSPAPTVQWQSSSDGGQTYSNIPGATSTTLTVPATAVTNGNLYRAVFSNKAGQAASTPASLAVNFTLQLFGQPQALTVAPGTPIRLTTVLPPGGVPVNVQWMVSTDNGVTYTPIAGANSASYSFTAQLAENGNIYQVVITKGSSTTMTATFTLTVDALPIVTSAPMNQTVALGQSVTFTASASSTPPATMQWQISSDGGLTFTNIPGATSTKLILSKVTLAQNGTRYRVFFTNPAGQVFSSVGSLTVA